jgi:hypothetical protein
MSTLNIRVIAEAVKARDASNNGSGSIKFYGFGSITQAE